MLEVFISILIFAIMGYLAIKAIGNILKGLLLLFLAILIYYIVSSSFNFQFSNISYFIKLPVEKIKEIFFKLEIISVSKSVNNNLVVVIKNAGYLPLTNFSLKVDGKTVKILNNPSILLPKNSAVLEADWKESFREIEIEANGVKTIYKASSL